MELYGHNHLKEHFLHVFLINPLSYYLLHNQFSIHLYQYIYIIVMY